MSRDFVIYFENKKQLNEAYKKLIRLKIHNITNRKKIKAFKILKEDLLIIDIFVSLTFDQNLTENHYSSLNKVNVLAKDFTDFVAIKNGIHSPLGFLFANTKKFSFKKSLYVNKIFNIINNFLINEYKSCSRRFRICWVAIVNSNFKKIQSYWL